MMGDLFLFILIGGALSTALCIHLGRCFKPRRRAIFITLDMPKHLPDLAEVQDQLIRGVAEAARIPDRYFERKPPFDTGMMRKSISMMGLPSWVTRGAIDHERREVKRAEIEALGGWMCPNCESALGSWDRVCLYCWTRKPEDKS